MENTSDLKNIKNKLLVDHLRFVKRITYQIIKSYHYPLDYFDDGYAVGVLAMIQKLEEYSLDLNTKFTTFCYKRVTGAIIDHFHCLLSSNGKKSTNADKNHFFVLSYMRYITEDLNCGDKIYEGITPEQLLSEKEDYKIIDSNLNFLPPYQRQICEAHYYQGLSFREIAKKFKFSPCYISKLHTKAICKLRSMYYRDNAINEIAA